MRMPLRPQDRALRAYRAYIDRVTSVTVIPHSEQADEVVRLVNLSLIAVVAIPCFVTEFGRLGLWNLSLALSLASVLMIGAPWILRWSGSIALARELVLSSLFAFKAYETFYFSSVISPGAMWFTAIPVLAILMGSVRSGIVWIVVSSIALIVLNITCEGSIAFMDGPAAQSSELYTFSLVFLIISVATYTLMVDHSRKQAFQRLAEATESVRSLAIRDPLTGAFNRRYIWEHLQREEDHVRTSHRHSSILLIDIDRFKWINDRYGHGVGDIVIKAVSDTIAVHIQGNDCFGRYGGEEFIGVIRLQSPRDGMRLAEQIRLSVARLAFDPLAMPAGVTVSIGVASFSKDDAFATTLAQADGALYRAKAAGRNCVREAPPSGRTKGEPTLPYEASAA